MNNTINMDEIKKVVMSISEDLKQQNKEMTITITENLNKNIDEKFSIFDKKNIQILEKIQEQDVRLDILEREVRKKNLLIFGLEETEKSYKDLEKKIIVFFDENMKLKYKSLDFGCIRRLGRKNEKIRPVIITVNSMGTKIEIFKNKKKLQNTTYYITEDYPPRVLAKRKELQVELSKIRQEGKKAMIKYDKLVVLEENYKRTSNNKRKLLVTPERIDASGTSQDQNHSAKKVATNSNNLASFVIRHKPKK